MREEYGYFGEKMHPTTVKVITEFKTGREDRRARRKEKRNRIKHFGK